MTYFNEIDPIACAVLRACHAGYVDARSIEEVYPSDVRQYTRAHFFAGAGLWEVAAQIAGWPEHLPLWTASCPCQPFSVAGKGAGTNDPRHLWPDLFRLVRAVRPPVLVGEQVSGKAGYGWFDGVCADLEGEGYACESVDIPACAVDAPHRRNRLYWTAVANAHGGDPGAKRQQRGGQQRLQPQDGGHPGGARDGERAEIALVDADRGGHSGWAQDALGGPERRDAVERADGELEHAHGARLAFGQVANDRPGELRDEGHPTLPANHQHGGRSYWADAEWLACADGKARRTKPGLRLLVNGLAGRPDLWRLAGNSIVPQVATQVLGALLDTLEAGEPT